MAILPFLPFCCHARQKDRTVILFKILINPDTHVAKWQIAKWCNAPQTDGPCANDLLYNRQVRSCILPELIRDIPLEKNQVDMRRQEIKGRIGRTS